MDYVDEDGARSYAIDYVDTDKMADAKMAIVTHML